MKKEPEDTSVFVELEERGNSICFKGKKHPVRISWGPEPDFIPAVVLDDCTKQRLEIAKQIRDCGIFATSEHVGGLRLLSMAGGTGNYELEIPEPLPRQSLAEIVRNASSGPVRLDESHCNRTEAANRLIHNLARIIHTATKTLPDYNKVILEGFREEEKQRLRDEVQWRESIGYSKEEAEQTTFEIKNKYAFKTNRRMEKTAKKISEHIAVEPEGNRKRRFWKYDWLFVPARREFRDYFKRVGSEKKKTEKIYRYIARILITFGIESGGVEDVVNVMQERTSTIISEKKRVEPTCPEPNATPPPDTENN